jgi:hypothetical protein
MTEKKILFQKVMMAAYISPKRELDVFSPDSPIQSGQEGKKEHHTIWRVRSGKRRKSPGFQVLRSVRASAFLLQWGWHPSRFGAL